MLTFLTLGLAALTAPAVVAQNVQDGTNSSDIGQDADGDTGDATGGQSVSVTGGTRTSIDATNSSDRVRARSGDSDADNSSTSFTGLSSDGDPAPPNVQSGDNDLDLSQRADASTGDAVAGQIVGVIAPNGGLADLVLANRSTNIVAVTGDGDEDNDESSFVGLSVGPLTL
jgi:hypothetical protein